MVRKINDEIKHPPVLNRAVMKEEVARLMKPYAQIAPSNRFHDYARELPLKGAHGLEEDADVLQRELHKASRQESLPHLKPYLDRALEGPEKDIEAYHNRYQRNVIQDLRDEAEEDFVQRISPHIQQNFIMNGAFHSGAREKLLKEAAFEKEKSLHREIARLLAHAEDQAMAHHHEHKKRHLHAADLVAQTSKQDKEGTLHTAEQIRQAQIAKNLATDTLRRGVAEEAQRLQGQEQNEIDVRDRQFEREQNLPLDRLHEQRNFVSGLDLPQVQTAHMRPVPPYPSQSL